jgi:hypothetical protein
MLRRMRNKRGQISSTLTWVVGFLIIFFIMFLFMSASLIIIGKREAPVIGEEKQVEIEGKKAYFLTAENFIVFLSSPVKVDGNIMSMAELFKIYYNEGKYKDLVKKKTSEFLDPQQYCSKKYGKMAWNKYYRTYLIEIDNKKFASSYFNKAYKRYLIFSQIIPNGNNDFTIKLYKGMVKAGYLAECEGRKDHLYLE